MGALPDMWVDCFERAFGQTVCLASCSHGKNNTCRTPFAVPLAQARSTWKWPDTVCIGGAGSAFVEADAFREKYNNSCAEYCLRGVGKVVIPYEGADWMSVEFEGTNTGTLQCCPGDVGCTHQGVKCECSFPDRRM